MRPDVLVTSLDRLHEQREALTSKSPQGDAQVLALSDAEAMWESANVERKRTMLINAMGSQHLFLDRAQEGGARKFRRSCRVRNESG